MTIKFMAFSNETDAYEFDGLVIENRLDRVSISGNMEITRDKAGLEKAYFLKRFIDSAIDEMKRDKTLPESVADKEEDEVDNPFA